MALEDAEKIMEKIVSGSGKSAEEVQKLIEEKKAKFSGLLTDAGAAFMIAKELNVKMDVEKTLAETVKIAKLEDGMTNVDVIARVMQIFPQKKFEKNGKTGVLCNLIVADDSGEIRLTLWRNDAKKLEEEKIERGTLLLLKNCYVTSYKEKKQLNMGYNGSMEISPQVKGIENFPQAETVLTKLSELVENKNDVNVVGRIVRIFNAREFSKDGNQGKLLNFALGDGEKTVRATAWNDLVEIVQGLNEGDIVKIEGAYTKKGLQGEVELQLGWRARVLKDPIGVELPALDKMLGQDFQEKKISELKEGDRFVKLNATVIELQQGNLHYKICRQCNSKIQQLEGGWVCSKCGEVKEPAIEEVIGLKIDDGSGNINAVFYGREAEKIIGIEKQELEKIVSNGKIGETINELSKRIVGQKLKLTGFVRKNKFTKETEFVGKSIEMS